MNKKDGREGAGIFTQPEMFPFVNIGKGSV